MPSPMSKEANHAALLMAVKLAGNGAKLAKICGCSRANISRQVRLKAGLPSRYVNRVEETLRIPRHVLRSDLYPLAREA